jgi:glycosyltransferase involved in cell wall biosynthesis
MDIREYKKTRTSPFFSVCVEVHNRSLTIRRVIEAILNQTCQDFELIIVDNGSTDESIEIIKGILSNYTNKQVKFFKESYKKNEIEGWNRPLKFAKGRYIAICEGDDFYCPEHLEIAKKILTDNPNTGIYIAGSKLTKFESAIQISESTEKLYDLKMLRWCPPPSCLIFRRISPDGEQYLFDENFVWAGEYSLYYKILKNKEYVIENYNANYVLRGFRFYLKTSFHMRDMLLLRHGNYFQYSAEEKSIVDTKIALRALHMLVVNLYFMKLDKRLFRIILDHWSNRNIGFLMVVKTLWNASKLAIVQRVQIRNEN